MFHQEKKVFLIRRVILQFIKRNIRPFMQVSSKVLLLICFFSLGRGLSAQEIDSKKLITHISFLASDELMGRAPETDGGLQARKYIQEEFTSYGLKSQYLNFLQPFSFENRRTKKRVEGAANVVSFIAGSESRKIIVVTAHYDHVGIGVPNAEGDSIYNGADDNASGTSALLAISEYFSKHRPKHSMIFAALDAEEMGLQGAKALLEDFPFPLEDILLNINMDMVGRNEDGEIYASGTYQNPSLKPILESAAQGLFPKLLFGHDIPGTRSDDWTHSSDHGPFVDEGIPHIYFGVEDHKDYHQPSDDILGINPDFFSASANLILKCIITLDEELAKE